METITLTIPANHVFDELHVNVVCKFKNSLFKSKSFLVRLLQLI